MLSFAFLRLTLGHSKIPARIVNNRQKSYLKPFHRCLVCKMLDIVFLGDKVRTTEYFSDIWRYQFVVGAVNPHDFTPVKNSEI